jgi:UDP-N-acetylmuramyl pentapeptide phosphotransferase/UDP-N-acetylglucosamine-1-phosphate transferase
MKSIQYLLGSLLVGSYALTWLIKTISLKNNILDMPNERSSHSIPTPRGGGLAIVICWYLGISILWYYGIISIDLYLALMCGILLAGISLLDDIYGLKPFIRLLVQTLTTILAVIFLGGIDHFMLPGKVIIPSIIMYPLVIVGIIWFINLYNFLDGIDGYASVEAISVAIALFLFAGESINLVLIASVLGFLIWNWPKARIFMGDIGSTQLGFILIILGIYYHNVQTLSFIWWIVITAPFWFDATLTLIRRWRKGENLSQAHRKHIYQRLVQSGYSHLKVTVLLILVNFILIFLVYIVHDIRFLEIPFLFLTIVLMYLIAVFTDRRKPFLPG